MGIAARSLALAGLAVACAATPHRSARPGEFDTTVAEPPATSEPLVMATGGRPEQQEQEQEQEDAGPARNPPDAGVVVVDQGLVPPPHDPAPTAQIVIPAAWRRCKAAADCTLVGSSCTAEHVFAVNRRFESTLEDGVHHACGVLSARPEGAARCVAHRCALPTSPGLPRPRPAR